MNQAATSNAPPLRADRKTTQICASCIMDTSDPWIEFDANGVCNHCRKFSSRKAAMPDKTPGSTELIALVAQIKRAGIGRRYDCIIGLSGGVDSTYAALRVKQLGLRALAVHFDNGWNSELAVKNIEQVVTKLGFDLFTHVMDWEQFRDLQIAFLRASVTDAEVPTDHGIMAVVLRLAQQHKIRYFLSGSNHETEGVLPIRWTYGTADWRYIKSVHKMFGETPITDYPHYGLTRRILTILTGRIRTICILNYGIYNKQEAMAEIQEKLGWRYYGGKHYESIYTRFFQSYILPRKFGVDKRKAHLSSLILAGQITRNQALAELGNPTYPENLLREDRAYVIKKLGLSEKEFEKLLALPTRTFLDYPTQYRFLQRIAGLVGMAKRLKLIPSSAGI